MIAGLVTIRQDGVIEGCNDVFVKYMFGYSQEELVTGQKSIGDLMPQFPGVLQSLRRDDLLQHGVIINNIICRKLVADLTTPSTTPAPAAPQGGKRLTQTPNGQPLPVLIAVHRDGTEFEIQLQLKLAEESDDGICALWITFDRDSTLSRVGHKMGGPALELKQHNGLGLPTAKRDERIIDEEDEQEDDDDDDNRPTSLASSVSVSDNDCQNDPSSIHTNRTLEYTKETQPRQYQPHTEKTEPMIIPLKTAGYSSSPSTHDSPGMGGSLSVSRPPCDTGSPRVTSFSRPTFSTYTQQEDQPSPTSPSTPYSPTAFGGNRPRAFSTASVTMPEYSAQTHSLCIDDFEILDEIGQGAYGLVKLAVQKKDMSQVNQRGKSTCMQKKKKKKR